MHSRSPEHPAARATTIANETRILVLIALVMTLAAGIGSIVVVHLLMFLQARGAEFASRSRSGRCSGRRRSARA